MEVTAVTAATITRRQLRELHDWAGKQPNRRRLEKSCMISLFGAEGKDLRRGETREVAKARCAAAWNLLHGTPSPTPPGDQEMGP